MKETNVENKVKTNEIMTSNKTLDEKLRVLAEVFVERILEEQKRGNLLLKLNNGGQMKI